MARQFTSQPHFSFGEISPRLYGREDVTPREAGCRVLTNMFVAPQGGVYKRPGTKFLYDFGSTLAHLQAYQISDTLSYALAFTDTASGNADLPYDMLLFAGNGSSGSVVATLDSPFDNEMAAAAKYAQTETANGMLFAAHPDGNWFMAYVADTDLRWLELSYNELGQFLYNDGEHLTLRMLRGPWLPTNFYGQVTQLEATQLSVFDYRIDIDGPATGGGAGSQYLIPSGFIEGRYIDLDGKAFRLTGTTLIDPNNAANEWRSYEAVLVHDPLAELPLAFPTPIKTQFYRPSAFVPGIGAYSVAYHQGRLWFGGSPEAPNIVWASKSGDPFHWMDGAEDDDAIIRTVGSGNKARITWMASTGRRLLIGTDGGEFAIEASEDSVLTPLSARVVQVGSKGASSVAPVVIDDGVTYAERGGAKIRHVAYEFTADNLKSREQSLLSEHIPRVYGPVQQLAYARLPDEFIFGRLSDGSVFGITYVPEQSVEAFHRHTFGGDVESLAAVPSYNQDDRLFLLVNRTLPSGATGRFLEVLADPPSITDPWRADYVARRSYLIDSWHLDCAVQTYQGGAITNIELISSTRIRITSPAITTYQATLSVGVKQVYLRDIVGFRYAEETLDDDGNPIGLNHENYLVDGSSVTSTTMELILDSAISGVVNTYTDGAAWGLQLSTGTGLTHLNGETAVIVGDGRLLNPATVSGGSVTLSPVSSTTLAGLAFDTEMVTSELLPPVPQGTSQGKLTRVIGADIRVLNSGPFQVRGYDRYATFDWFPRSVTASNTTVLPDDATAVTRIEYLELDHINKPEALVQILQEAPWPLHILSVSPRIDRAAR